MQGVGIWSALTGQGLRMLGARFRREKGNTDSAENPRGHREGWVNKGRKHKNSKWIAV